MTSQTGRPSGGEPSGFVGDPVVGTAGTGADDASSLGERPLADGAVRRGAVEDEHGVGAFADRPGAGAVEEPVAVEVRPAGPHHVAGVDEERRPGRGGQDRAVAGAASSAEAAVAARL